MHSAGKSLSTLAPLKNRPTFPLAWAQAGTFRTSETGAGPASWDGPGATNPGKSRGRFLNPWGAWRDERHPAPGARRSRARGALKRQAGVANSLQSGSGDGAWRGLRLGAAEAGSGPKSPGVVRPRGIRGLSSESRRCEKQRTNHWPPWRPATPSPHRFAGALSRARLCPAGAAGEKRLTALSGPARQAPSARRSRSGSHRHGRPPSPSPCRCRCPSWR